MKKGTLHEWSTIKKIRKTVLSKQDYIWIFRKGTSLMISESLSLWANRNHLSKGTLHQVATKYKNRKSYKGWTVSRFQVTKMIEEKLNILKTLISRHNKSLLEKVNKFSPFYKPNIEKYKEELKTSFNDYYIEKQDERRKEERMRSSIKYASYPA